MPEPQSQPNQEPTPASEAAPISQPEPEPEPEPEPRETAAEPRVAEAAPTEEPQQVEKKKPLSPVEPQAEPQAADSQWIDVVSGCQLSGISANLLANCVPELLNEERIDLVLDERQSSLFNEQYLDMIRQALDQYYGRTVHLNLRIGVPSGETPAAWRQRVRQERRQAIIDDFNNDTNVRAIMERFSATIRPESLELRQEDKI